MIYNYFNWVLFWCLQVNLINKFYQSCNFMVIKIMWKWIERNSSISPRYEPWLHDPAQFDRSLLSANQCLFLELSSNFHSCLYTRKEWKTVDLTLKMNTKKMKKGKTINISSLWEFWVYEIAMQWSQVLSKGSFVTWQCHRLKCSYQKVGRREICLSFESPNFMRMRTQNLKATVFD